MHKVRPAKSSFEDAEILMQSRRSNDNAVNIEEE